VPDAAVPPLASELTPEEVQATPPLGSLVDVARGARRRGGGATLHRLRGRDRVVVVVMVTIPLLLVVGLVWLPAVATVVLSFTNWDGIGDLDTITWIGTKNYHDVFTIYPPFEPAIRNNLLFLVVLFLVATPFGIFLAVLLDREMKGSRVYQTALYLPVVLSLALVGFIWQLLYSHDQGLINGLFGTDVDWYGDPKWNIWAVLVASSWRHVGYIMLLYLAGLKGVDPTLREAAAMDGAGEVRMFFRVIFPVMRPINIVILVITVIESLRAFDLVWVINKGRNGLELISALVTQNVIGEASRIGFGSALATIMLAISLVFIAVFLATAVREDR
jgi:multiple sugar transport system permease protein